MRLLALTLGMCCAFQVQAAEINLRVKNAPADGMLVFQVYDNANAFGDFRNPVREVRYPVQPDGSYVIRDVPAGTIAVLVYTDENDNRALDKSFIGIPKEPLGLSNSYRPKGPPSFQRASLSIAADEVLNLDIELYMTVPPS